ncbi:2-phospho-L-lactate guanylyltransferase [Bailinhaonella thermotolerans]|uniref:Phosphoenolpyruvate guanylyltransferase n=1 Tax=Bailinhaonella thermotolerans TaxID=1070861 RepID=A0A3A4AH75_9ACTN|nr:2-phospho-L-lactate guanylyltransferase [Bailinhaonella thermotolerans]RJL25053.1 2-phospho-L-lactate guanylyltransferase [Bailinhaonella thermotolerans]
MRPDNPPGWSIVVPVKPLAAAKSRLADLAREHRAPMALAVALDTVAAALACPRVHRVIVVTDDPVAAPPLAALGAIVIGDTPAAGLNPALRHGARHAVRLAPGDGVAALQADLPALRPAELAAALDAAAGFARSFVPDALGIGTTLYAVRPGAEFAPAFGGPSRARHLESGARELLLPGTESVRRDVDTPDDLREALTLGVGPRTAEVAALLVC